MKNPNYYIVNLSKKEISEGRPNFWHTKIKWTVRVATGRNQWRKKGGVHFKQERHDIEVLWNKDKNQIYPVLNKIIARCGDRL